VAIWNFCTKVPKPERCVWMFFVVGSAVARHSQGELAG